MKLSPNWWWLFGDHIFGGKYFFDEKRFTGSGFSGHYFRKFLILKKVTYQKIFLKMVRNSFKNVFCSGLWYFWNLSNFERTANFQIPPIFKSSIVLDFLTGFWQKISKISKKNQSLKWKPYWKLYDIFGLVWSPYFTHMVWPPKIVSKSHSFEFKGFKIILFFFDSRKSGHWCILKIYFVSLVRPARG